MGCTANFYSRASTLLLSAFCFSSEILLTCFINCVCVLNAVWKETKLALAEYTEEVSYDAHCELLRFFFDTWLSKTLQIFRRWIWGHRYERFGNTLTRLTFRMQYKQVIVERLLYITSVWVVLPVTMHVFVRDRFIVCNAYINFIFIWHYYCFNR